MKTPGKNPSSKLSSQKREKSVFIFICPFAKIYALFAPATKE
jgi:hypothetical protein